MQADRDIDVSHMILIAIVWEKPESSILGSVTVIVRTQKTPMALLVKFHMITYEMFLIPNQIYYNFLLVTIYRGNR